MRIDVHQHLWPPAFLDALRARRWPPRLDGGTLVLSGGDRWEVDLNAHDPNRRASGLELVCVAPSAALRIDRLAPEEAAELADVWLSSALALGEPFRVWATAGLIEPDPHALAAALKRGAVGLEEAADTLASIASRRCSTRWITGPLLVHPGPTAGEDARRPLCWTPTVPYVNQLHVVWGAWADGGRGRFPNLPICFAALAVWGRFTVSASERAAAAPPRRIRSPSSRRRPTARGPWTRPPGPWRRRHLPRIRPPVRRPRASRARRSCSARHRIRQPSATSRAHTRGGHRLTWPLDDVNPPSCRSLSAAALESLVTHVTSHPDLWEPTVDRTSLHRMYAALHRDAVVDVWAIFCRPGNDTGWHDHDTSSGAVRVVEGALTESQRVGAPHRCRVYRAGDCFSFDASHIHRLVCEDACVISIHAYSASVRRLGQHNLDRSGARHQVSVTYTDELRPLELPAA